MRCLYNRFVDAYRAQKRQPNLEDIDTANFKSLIPEVDRNKQVDQQSDILQAMEKLTAEQRAVVNLHDINGYTLPELAEIMGTPLGTLKSHLHRARQTLKKQLNLQPSDLAKRHY